MIKERIEFDAFKKHISNIMERENQRERLTYTFRNKDYDHLQVLQRHRHNAIKELTYKNNRSKG